MDEKSQAGVKVCPRCGGHMTPVHNIKAGRPYLSGWYCQEGVLANKTKCRHFDKAFGREKLLGITT